MKFKASSNPGRVSLCANALGEVKICLQTLLPMKIDLVLHTMRGRGVG